MVLGECWCGVCSRTVRLPPYFYFLLFLFMQSGLPFIFTAYHKITYAIILHHPIHEQLLLTELLIATGS